MARFLQDIQAGVQVENSSEYIIQLWTISMMQNIDLYAKQNQIQLSEEQRKQLLGKLFIEEFTEKIERKCS